MATEKATTYPKIGKRVWLLLRQRFAKSMPSTVGPDFIISVSDMSEKSAQSNVLNPLRDLGIIDKSNKPTELAERWRHDDEYKAVCDEIRTKTYPPGLIEAYPDGLPEQKEKIKNWFMKNSKVGEVAGDMFAATYIMLSQADLSVGNGEFKAKTSSAPRAATVSTKVATSKAVTAKTASVTLPPAPLTPPSPLNHEQHQGARRLPSVHIDVQVHISPDTTPEQIDRIFASMSKHLGSYIA